MSAQQAWTRSGPFGENCLDFVSHGVEQTHRIGRRLGELAEPGDVFLLTGDLGAGKTCLTQGIAMGLGIGTPITSPTFTLLNEYTARSCGGRLSLYHADLYRLDKIEEISELGLDEYLFGKGLTVIEWVSKGMDILPEEHLLIEIDYLEDDERKIKLTAKGKRYEELLEKLKDFKVEKKR